MTLDTPKISVIIPLYNKVSYIGRAIDSVLSQTEPNFEILVIGGKSNDGSENIVRNYTDPRIRLIDELGFGVSAARNQGVHEASSDIVAFLDADDEWYPYFIETILDLRLRFPEAGMYGTGYDVYSKRGSLRHCYNLDINTDITEMYFKYIVLYPRIIITSSSVFDKKKFVDLGGFPEGYPWNEDAALFSKFVFNHSVVYSSKSCVRYYEDTLNNTSIPKEWQENPNLDYILSLPEVLRLSRGDSDYINIYCEMQRKDGWIRNFYLGLSKKSKEQLTDLYHPAYTMDLRCMRFIQLIPDSVVCLLRKNRFVDRIFRYGVEFAVRVIPSAIRFIRTL